MNYVNYLIIEAMDGPLYIFYAPVLCLKVYREDHELAIIYQSGQVVDVVVSSDTELNLALHNLIILFQGVKIQ